MRIITLIIAIVIGNVMWSQQVPETAKQHFKEQYNHSETASNVTWNALDNGFEVTYSSNNREGHVFYDDKGYFKESRVSMQFKELEQSVKDYVASHFGTKDVTYCYRLNTQTAPERSVVQLEINGQQLRLFFRPDGTFHYQEQ
jgi:hypothetical protein